MQGTAARQFEIADLFPFGLASFALLLIAMLSGGWLLMHPAGKKTATLTMWVFAKTHYSAYQKAIPSFERLHPGTTVDLQLVHGDAIKNRLMAAFLADLDVPDLVEVEIGGAGTFFRGPVDEIGFMDLTDWLRSSGLMDQLVKARFAPYTHRGHIYGLPHDVHPVMIAYRRDLFEAEGVDVAKLKTWDDFIRVGRRVRQPNKRYFIELSESSAMHFEVFLFQRGGGYFDEAGRLRMDDEVALRTLLWYIPLVTGPESIGTELVSGSVSGQSFAQALEQGYLMSFLCPDWRSKFTEFDVPRIAGKMALMPMPRFSDGGYGTGTWGGTMLAVTRKCRTKALALEFMQHLYMNKSDLAERFRELNIIPSWRNAWTDPAFLEPRAYWSNQPLGQCYADLASQVPPQYTSPFVDMTKTKMSTVIASCAAYYRVNEKSDFEAFARRQLRQAADEVRRAMKRNPY